MLIYVLYNLKWAIGVKKKQQNLQRKPPKPPKPKQNLRKKQQCCASTRNRTSLFCFEKRDLASNQFLQKTKSNFRAQFYA